MRPIRVAVAAKADSAAIPLDTYIAPFNVGIGVTISSGASLTYSVQYTYDDVTSSGFDPATATWFTVAALSAKTAGADGAITSPVTAVRLSVSVHSSGTATMTVIQAGAPGK